MGQINVLNEKGDQTIEWQPDNTESVAKAQGAFDALKKEGYEFYESETKEVETKGKVVKAFKKTLGKVIAVPGVQGGSRAMRGGPPNL